MHHPAQQRAVEARIGKWQVLGLAGQEGDLRILATSGLDQFGADIEPSAIDSPHLPGAW
jgi:hypothetical protein